MNALTLTEMKELATLFASSRMFQDVHDMAQAFVRIKAGEELGIGAFTAMSELFIVKGKVVMSANLQAAKVKESGKYDYRVLKLDDEGCDILFLELVPAPEQVHERLPIGAWREIGKSFFGPREAQKAGLAGGDNYRKYDRNMYFARAMSNGVAWYCPDVTIARTYTPGELLGSERPTEAPDASEGNVARLERELDTLGIEKPEDAVSVMTFAEKLDKKHREVTDDPMAMDTLEKGRRRLEKELKNDIPAATLRDKKGTSPDEIARRLNAAIAERSKTHWEGKTGFHGAKILTARRSEPEKGWDADGQPVHPLDDPDDDTGFPGGLQGARGAGSDEPMKLTKAEGLTYVDRILMQIGRIVPKANFGNGVRRGHICDVIFEAFAYQPKPEDLDRLMETLKGFDLERLKQGLAKLEKMEPR